MTKPTQIRYDLNGNSHLLDLDSQERLLNLAMRWSDQNDALVEAAELDLADYEDTWPCLKETAR